MQVLLLRYLCLVTNTANGTEYHTSGTETAKTNEIESQTSPAYSESNLLLTPQIQARWCEACESKEFLCKEMEYNFNGIKFCDLLVQKHRFKNSLNDLRGIETSEILSNFENDIDASIKSVLNAFEETRDACCAQLEDDHFASIRVFDIYKAAQVGQIAKCDALKRSSFATYGDIEKFQGFFINFQIRYVYDCVKLKIFEVAESIVLSKNVASYINFLQDQLSNPSLEEPLITDIEDARDDNLAENESTVFNLSMGDKSSTDIDDARIDNLEDNEGSVSNPSMGDKSSTDIDDARIDTLKENDSPTSSLKEISKTSFDDASDDTLKDNGSVITKPSMKEPLSTDIEDTSDDTLKDNGSTMSNPPMKEPLSTDIEDARYDTLKENESTLSNPSVEEPLTTNIDDASDDTLKDNESSKSNPPMKDPLSKDFEKAEDDNLEDNEGSTSSSNNSWVYVK